MIADTTNGMLPPDDFLASHWQKKPVMFHGAHQFSGPQLSVDEVAWLATQPDVESRLVFTDRTVKPVRYQLEHGPFSDSELSALPGEDWTLLVQDVDKHLPEFRQWFDAVNFIPDWRIDDLMISVAAPGGGVGPHVDNYDVFLVQVSGHRNWTIGRPETVSPDTSAESLSLVLPFEPTDSWDAGPADVLYLPPGVPHHGVATDLCTTYSIGMRAPSRRDLLAGVARIMDRDDVDIDVEDAFYADPDLSASESRPGEIAAATIERLRRQQLLEPGINDAELAHVLGAVVTDPKAWLLPDRLSPNEEPERIHGMARLAWSEAGNLPWIFVNGTGRNVDVPALRIFRCWCESRVVGPSDLADLAANSADGELLEWLLQQGTFDTGHSEE